MANEHWYVLRVRSGFSAFAALRLRKLAFEVFVPEPKSSPSQEPHQLNESVYCRFDLQQRQSVMTVPGVVDILGTPVPVPADNDLKLPRFTTRL